MATTGVVYTNYGDRSRLYVSWSRTGTWNSSTCGSNIDWVLYLDNHNYWYSNAIKCYGIYINGVLVYSGGTFSNKTASGSIALASGTTTIEHNADGQKSFSISLSGWFYSNSNVSGSGDFTLDVIPRASQPTCVTYPTTTTNVGDIGSTITIYMNRSSANFTHYVYCYWGSESPIGIASDVEESTSFTIPMDFCNNVPNGVTGYGKIYVDTYNDDTLIGTKYVDFTATVPASVVPSCSISVSDPMEYATTYSGYVKSKSKLAITVTPTTAYNSAITAYSINADNIVYDESSVTTQVIKNAGTLVISASVTDTRGRTGTASTSVTVLDYSNPTIISLAVHRCDLDGTENQRGSYCSARYSYNITELSSLNGKSAYLLYKKSSDTDYTAIELSAVYSASDLGVIFAADDGSSYDVKIQIADSFTATSRSTRLSTGFCLYSIPASGEGLTIGGVAEGNDFNVLMPANFSGGLTENMPILPSGNCNDILKSGNYYIGTTGTNRPGDVNGWLTVKAYETGNYCFQQYVTYTGVIFYRVRDNGTWQPWVQWSSSDVITETGSSGIWTYRKWNSGIAECWGQKYTSGVNASATNYQGFYYSASIRENYPFIFVEKPVLYVEGSDATNSSVQIVREFGGNAEYASYHVMCLTNQQTNLAINTSLRAIGRWY